MKFFYRITATLMIFISLLSSAHAAVVISGTRFIYPEAEKEITIQLRNPSKSASLVQSWIEASDKDTKKAIPFVITPELSRVDPNKGQTLRIIYTGEALPQDRESLYYLMILDVPPKPKAGEKTQNFLQLALQSKLKFFFRPKGLTGDANQAPAQVSWQWTKTTTGKNALQVNNTTPYYITYKSVSVEVNGKTYKANKAGMVSPKSNMTFEFSSLNTQPSTVHYTTVNDFGANVNGQITIK